MAKSLNDILGAMNVEDRLVVEHELEKAKQAVEALQASEKRLSFALEGSNSGIWDWNLQTGDVYFDSHYFTMAGYSPNEFPHKFEEWRKRLHPEDIMKAENAINSYLNNCADRYSVEFRFQRKNGTWMWVLGQGRIFEYDENTRPVRFTGTHLDITALKHSETVLKSAKDEFQFLFENNPVSFWLEDFSETLILFEHLRQNGVNDLEQYLEQEPELLGEFVASIRILDVNQATLKLHRAGNKEALFQGLARIFSEESFSAFRKILLMLWRGQAEVSVETTLKTLEGRILHVILCSKVLPASPVSSTRILISAQDISEIKKIEKAMLSERNKAKSYLDLAGHLFVATDRQGKVTLINKKACEVLGHTEPEILGENWFSHIVSDNSDEFDFSGSETWLSEQADSVEYVEYPIISSTGEQRLIAWRNVLLKNEKGEVVGHLSSGDDITEKKRAENALMQSEEKFRSVVTHSDAIIFILDQKGMFTLSEGKALASLGLKPGQVVGMSCMDVYKDYPEILNAIRLSLSGKKIHSILKVGEIVFDVFFNPVFGMDESVRQVVGVATNISQRVQAEKAVLESQRLGAIGEMASAVAHDFNNSLQSIFGNLELVMLAKSIPEPVQKQLHAAITAAEDAATRVQMLQRFGGQKKVVSIYGPVNLNTVIEDVILQTRPLWKDRAEKEGLVIDIQKDFSSAPYVLGNDGELRSAVYNIVKNSLEAMPNGGRLLFETKTREDQVEVRISDSGIGMSEEVASKVFQPFFSTKGFELGRGFGLSGAYSILKEHGGRISVLKSKEGSGTIIELTVPAISAEHPASVSVIQPENKEKVRILWVDDDTSIREIAEQFLEVMGYKGDVVGSGDEALKKLDQHNYDLVITDIGMPGMSGWDLALKIKEKFHGKMKVAVLTGWGAQINREKKAAYGVGFVLGKPISLKELKNLILEAVQN